MARIRIQWLTSLAAVTVASLVVHASPAYACSPASQFGWQVNEPRGIANGLPTDAPIPLGVTFFGPGSDSSARGTLQVHVTDADGSVVDGSVESKSDSGSNFFRPAAPLAPNTHYQVSTRIEGGTIASGPPTRTFELTTTAGPMPPLAIPANLTGSVSLAWETFGDDFVCCDGATPEQIDSCGGTPKGYCFPTAGAPRTLFTLSWTPFPAEEQAFLRYNVVDANAKTSGTFGEGGKFIGVEFESEATEYCAAIEVTNTARLTPETVRSSPICVAHGALPPLASYKPDFSEDLRKCTTAPAGYEAEWASATGHDVPASSNESASSDAGGCALSTRGHSGGLAGWIVLVAASIASAARLRRRRAA